MRYFVIGEDKSLKDVSEDVLALIGGNMKGNIGFDSGSRIRDIIRFIAGDANGSGIAIGDGGTTVIGGGESAALLQPADGGGAAERMIIANDTDIEFWVNCQNGADAAIKVTLSRSTGLLSGHQKVITSGTAAPSGGANGDIYIQY